MSRLMLHIWRESQWQYLDVPQFSVDFIRDTGQQLLSLPAELLAPPTVDEEGEPIDRPNFIILPPWRLVNEDGSIVLQQGDTDLEIPPNVEVRR